jgi:hypothetical protein
MQDAAERSKPVATTESPSLIWRRHPEVPAPSRASKDGGH